MGFLEEAENLFLIAMDDTDLNFEASYLAAQTMSSRGSHASAAEILLSLLSESLDQKKKDLVPVYYLLGEVNEALKNMVESKKFYLKASEIDQNFRDLKAKLGE
jgi:tetratricopeptide (TPR) repeat protein